MLVALPFPLDEVEPVVVVLVPATGSSVTDARNDWLSTRMVDGMKPRGSLRARRFRLTIFKMNNQMRMAEKTGSSKSGQLDEVERSCVPMPKVIPIIAPLLMRTFRLGEVLLVPNVPTEVVEADPVELPSVWEKKGRVRVGVAVIVEGVEEEFVEVDWDPNGITVPNPAFVLVTCDVDMIPPVRF